MFPGPLNNTISADEDLPICGLPIEQPIAAIGKPDTTGKLYPIDVIPVQTVRHRRGLNEQNKKILSAFLKEPPELVKNKQPSHKVVFEMGMAMVVACDDSDAAMLRKAKAD